MPENTIKVKYRNRVKLNEQFYIKVEAPASMFARDGDVVLKLMGSGGALEAKDKTIQYDDERDEYGKRVSVKAGIRPSYEGEKFEVKLSFSATMGTEDELDLYLEHETAFEKKVYLVKIAIDIVAADGMTVINHNLTAGGNIQGTVSANEYHLPGKDQEEVVNGKSSLPVFPEAEFKLIGSKGKNVSISLPEEVPELEFIHVKQPTNTVWSGDAYWIMSLPVVQDWCEHFLHKNPTDAMIERRVRGKGGMRIDEERLKTYKKHAVGERLPLTCCEEEVLKELMDALHTFLVEEHGLPRSYRISLPTNDQWLYAAWDGDRPSRRALESMARGKDRKTDLCVVDTESADAIQQKEMHRFERGWHCKQAGRLKGNTLGLKDCFGQVFEAVFTEDIPKKGEVYVQGASFRTNTLKKCLETDEYVHASHTLTDVLDREPFSATRGSTQVGYRFVINPA